MNVIAVDVGTTSVRLAIISFQGKNFNEASVLSSHKRDIEHYQNGSRFEQNSKQIWQAICECSKECLTKSKVKPNSIKSIGFSATCSLVINRDESDESLNDIIMWMDHRAIDEARMISEGNSTVLNQFGGVCSPEFSLAKLLWLQNHDPSTFNSANGFFELPDWLVYRCIGGEPLNCPRSLCCVTCKWGYDVENSSHCKFIDSKNFANKIGHRVLRPGSVSGFLSPSSAFDLGLIKESNKENSSQLRIAVGTSLIDAHSGMLAMLSIPLENYDIKQNVESTFCSLAGTSSCHMLLSKDYNFTRGVWGPYKDVVIEGYYLLEAGQSLTGKLIEICIESHIEGKMQLESGESIYDIIANLNDLLENNQLEVILHVLPTFHGNRSPLANPRLLGGVYGLSSEGPKSLLEYYVATVESLCYETKLITETLGIQLETFLISGGLMKNEFYMQTMADVLQCKVVKMGLKEVDFMVMGSGLVARHAGLCLAGKSCGTLREESIKNMSYDHIDIKTYEPRVDRVSYHVRKYKCYKEFVNYSQRVDEIMQ